MKRNQRGGALVKYLLAVFFVAMLGCYFYWKANYGLRGHVDHLTYSTTGYIAFLRQDTNGHTDLFIVKPDGTDARPLTNDGVPKHAPTWSPNGKSLCYAAEAKDTGEGGGSGVANQLFVLGAGEPNQITYGSASKDMPQWQPNGKLIAFLAGGAVKVVEENGSSLEQVYPPPHKSSGANENSGDNSNDPNAADNDSMNRPPLDFFRWSPGGTAIAGVQVVDGEAAPAVGRSGWWSGSKSLLKQGGPTMIDPESVVVLPGLDKKPSILRMSDGTQSGFCWFPDGKSVAVATSTSHNVQALLVYRTDSLDQDPQPLFLAKGMSVALLDPAVSPDGSKIACEVWKLNSAADRQLLGIALIPSTLSQPIVVQNAAGIARIPLFVKGTASSPQWSPDGKYLLYTMPGTTKMGRDLWTIQADGKNPMNLTKGKGDNFDAVWSPAK